MNEKREEVPLLSVTATEGSTASSQATAGRDLDALVAVKVMGLTLGKNISGGTLRYYEEGGVPIRFYSTDISSAWQVIEKVAPWDENGFPAGRFRFALCMDGSSQWWAAFQGVVRDDESYADQGETAPLAICLAALKAVEAK